MNETVFNIILIFVFILIGGVRCRGDGIGVTSPSQVKRLVRRRRRGQLVARLHESWPELGQNGKSGRSRRVAYAAMMV